ncbi:hypothetical protein Goklo_001699, partial [Gossypium klotzschianum]|nr:hypothetical protein [Gossypium klotzschianum]
MCRYDVDMFLSHRVTSSGETFFVAINHIASEIESKFMCRRFAPKLDLRVLKKEFIVMILSVLFYKLFDKMYCFLKEVRVRFVGFGAEEDEWVNVKKAVRGRSIPFEHSECCKVMVGGLVLCLQERRDQSIYYDAHVLEIERKTHDIRGDSSLEETLSNSRLKIQIACTMLAFESSSFNFALVW